MKLIMRSYLIVFLSLFLFSACDNKEEAGEEGDDIEVNDVSVNVADQLNGSWESTKVLRSGNDTDMGPFSLEYNSAENTLTSNLFDANQNFPYENGVKATLKGYSLTFENLADTFYIDSIDEKNLVLSTTIHNFPFEFTFEKK